MRFRERPIAILLSDIAAAVAVAFGTAWALTALFHMPALVASGMAGIIFVRIFSSLRRHVSTLYRLPQFEPAPLELEPDELLLADVVGRERDSRVVPIFAGAAPGELRAQIERHSRVSSIQQQPRSASDELAEALAELRRSLR